MSTPKTPRPTTRTALLVSEGYGRDLHRVTKHKFIETRECVLPGDGEAYEFIFECEETGHERRWGTTFKTTPVIEGN